MSEKVDTTTKWNEKQESPKNMCDLLYCVHAGKERCSSCKRAHYCSKEHQKLDCASHKHLCKHPEREWVVDGYKLCHTILKCNDGVHSYLAGKVFDKVVKSGGDYEGDILIYTKSNKENDEFKIVDTPLLFQEDGAMDEEGIMAYWAIRSITSGYSLNTALVILLEEYRSKGYKSVIFDKLCLPLDDSLAIDFFYIEPKFNVKVVDPNQDPPKLDSVLTEVVSLGDYTLTLSSGQFWKFDESGGNRPIYIEKSLDFVRPIGKLERVADSAKHKDRMYKNGNMCSRLASILHLATKHLDIPYMKNHPHIAGAPIELQADKMYLAKMIKHAKFEQTVAGFIKKSETPFTANLNTLADLCARSDIAMSNNETR